MTELEEKLSKLVCKVAPADQARIFMPGSSYAVAKKNDLLNQIRIWRASYDKISSLISDTIMRGLENTHIAFYVTFPGKKYNSKYREFAEKITDEYARVTGIYLKHFHDKKDFILLSAKLEFNKMCYALLHEAAHQQGMNEYDTREFEANVKSCIEGTPVPSKEDIEKRVNFYHSKINIYGDTLELEEILGRWRDRRLGETPYLALGTRREKVRYRDAIVNAEVLVAAGVRINGRPEILGVSVSLSEAAEHWYQFIRELFRRGLCGVRFITSDDYTGLSVARRVFFAGVLWQRCQRSLIQDAVRQSYQSFKKEEHPHLEALGNLCEMAHARSREVVDRLGNIFAAQSRLDANALLMEFVRRYKRSAPNLSAWALKNIPAALTVHQLPSGHRRLMREATLLTDLICNDSRNWRMQKGHPFPDLAKCLQRMTDYAMWTCEKFDYYGFHLDFQYGPELNNRF
ncbi:MAG TPA: hypothetical protein ENO22_13975 [candidate division Zixibacteria bacterium]|nr:hypothetical protein [candidate division Zixibacteria bacterium]